LPVVFEILEVLRYPRQWRIFKRRKADRDKLINKETASPSSEEIHS
ncbi:MAG: hypothetical protein HRT88_13600, partial [Lentisphaeraceae bacterium]|nr:hypothetical protein [Lentisphaeraceae bacterium]